MRNKKSKKGQDGFSRIKMAKCANCGKMFVPAPEHAYRDKLDRLYCSYTCFRVWEKAEEKKLKDRIKRMEEKGY